MLADPAAVDTNILVYAHLQDAKYHQSSRQLLRRAQADKIVLSVTTQILLEFYAVITDPKRVTAPFQPTDALDAINRLLAIPALSLIPPPIDLTQRWTTLVRQHPVTGPAVFDYQIVATMLGNGITTIYTYDRSGFEKFAGIDVLTP